MYRERGMEDGVCMAKAGSIKHITQHPRTAFKFKQATILVFCNVNVRTTIPSASSHGDDDWGV